MLFPKFATYSSDRESLILHFHGWIFDPELDSRAKKALLMLLSKKLGLGSDESRSERFQERAGQFLVNNKRGRKVKIRLGANTYEIGPSKPNGHVVATLTIATSALAESDVIAGLHNNGSITVDVLMPGGENYSHSIPILGPTGISVISDLDDTIKLSEVGCRRALLANTFLREFQPVPGMAPLYQRWAEQGFAFHYVSASPWQLYPPVQSFLQGAGFPDGSLSMKAFRWKDTSFFDLFAKSSKIKRPMIESIFQILPERKFILIGDTGESDAELYSSLVRAHPGRVIKILIRNSTNEDLSTPRWRRVFGGLSPSSWQIFSTPENLYDLQFPGSEIPTTESSA